MDSTTIQRLNVINHAFYAATAPEFDRSRSQPWPGWTRLLDHLPKPCESVLDVGCGNGRFGVFLTTSPPDPLSIHGEGENQSPALPTSSTASPSTSPIASFNLNYHGVDSSAALLEAARVALTEISHLTVTLERRDIIESPLAAGQYDLVAAFGLLHHIPGATARRDFLRGLAARVRPGGLLAFACWRFYEYERFRSRVVPWPDDLINRVERHDYLLDWRRGGGTSGGGGESDYPLRYCHYVDDAEHDALAAVLESAGMREIIRYRADGEGDALNCYSLFTAIR